MVKIKMSTKAILIGFTVIVAYCFYAHLVYVFFKYKLQSGCKLTTVSLNDNNIVDYVFMDDNSVLVSVNRLNFELIKLNIATGKSETILIDKGELEIGHILRIYYDYLENRILAICRVDDYPDLRKRLYFIYLDNHIIEEFLTINDKCMIFYDPMERNVYITSLEKTVDIYNVDKRQFLKSMAIPENVSRYFEAVYGKPFQVLTSLQDGENRYYYEWNDRSNEGKIFNGINVNIFQPNLSDFIHLDGSRFLCVKTYKAYGDEIVEADLSTGKITSLISPQSWLLTQLRSYQNQRYGFVLYYDNRHVFYNPTRTLLCFFSYP
jgi:hypothetical protein